MSEEVMQIEQSEQSVDTLQDNGQYIEAIEKLKQTTVSKDKYAKLENENKKLLDCVLNGSQVDTPKPKRSMHDIIDLHKALFGKKRPRLNNLQFAEKTLEWRNALLELGELDPFLPVGKNINPTADDCAQAEKVAHTLKECVEYADGDSQLFTQELMRRTNDAMPLASNNFKRRK